MRGPTRRNRSLTTEWAILAALTLDLLFTLWAWPRLPDQVPIHWGVNGPDSFAPRWAGAFLPIVGSGLLYLYFRGSAAQRLEGYPPFLRRLYVQGIPVLILLVHLGTLIYAIR